jgi:hypothetical protein
MCEEWRENNILIARSCMVERNAVPRPGSLCKERSRVEGVAQSEGRVQARGLFRPICVRTGELSISLERQTLASDVG